MKKQYKAPLTEVVKINAEQMICQSLVDVYEGNPDKTLFKDDDFDFSEGSDFDLNFDKDNTLW